MRGRASFPRTTPPDSVPTLLPAHWKAANRGSRPAASAAPLESGPADADNERRPAGDALELQTPRLRLEKRIFLGLNLGLSSLPPSDAK